VVTVHGTSLSQCRSLHIVQDWACKNNVALEPIVAVPPSAQVSGSDNISNGHDEIIWAITKRDRRFFSASADRTVRVWDAVYGRCLHVLEGHQRPVLSLAATDSHLFSGSYDHTIRAWDMGSMRLVKSMQGTYPQNSYLHALKHVLHFQGHVYLTASAGQSRSFPHHCMLQSSCSAARDTPQAQHPQLASQCIHCTCGMHY
jgi:WD40 repeat protein